MAELERYCSQDHIQHSVPSASTSIIEVLATVYYDYGSPAPDRKRSADANPVPQNNAAAAAKWSSLRKQAASVVKTACGCINTTPACKSVTSATMKTTVKVTPTPTATEMDVASVTTVESTNTIESGELQADIAIDGVPRC